MTKPYTYLIGWTRLKKFYYGVRFAKGCSPLDLWVSYFTSSKQVKVVREQFGEPDLIIVRRAFTDVDEAKNWEHKVLRRMGASKRKDFLNLTDNRCSPSNAGIVRTDEFKQKISLANQGKLLTEEHKLKIAKAVSGKRPASFGNAVSEAMIGIKQTRETVEKRRAKQTGQKRSQEFCNQTRERLSVQVRGPDGTLYSSLKEAQAITGVDVKRKSKILGSGWVRIPAVR